MELTLVLPHCTIGPPTKTPSLLVRENGPAFRPNWLNFAAASASDLHDLLSQSPPVGGAYLAAGEGACREGHDSVDLLRGIFTLMAGFKRSGEYMTSFRDSPEAGHRLVSPAAIFQRSAECGPSTRESGGPRVATPRTLAQDRCHHIHARSGCGARQPLPSPWQDRPS